MGIEDIVLNNLITWAMLGVIAYLVKTLVRVDHSLCAMEVRIVEHQRRLSEHDKDIRSLEKLN